MCVFYFLRVVSGSIVVTDWDSLAHQAATTKWQGDGTAMALVAAVGLISALLC